MNLQELLLKAMENVIKEAVGINGTDSEAEESGQPEEEAAQEAEQTTFAGQLRALADQWDAAETTEDSADNEMTLEELRQAVADAEAAQENSGTDSEADERAQLTSRLAELTGPADGAEESSTARKPPGKSTSKKSPTVGAGSSKNNNANENPDLVSRGTGESAL